MTNKRKTLRLIRVMLGFFLLLLITMISKAEVGFAISVKPILPKNQHNIQATYYDLRMVPGQEQELKLELVNTSDKEQKITLQINDATTNDAGDIDYSDRSKYVPRDQSLKVSLKDIATAESEMIIPAKKTVIATVHLKMPKGQFNGMILGGIKVVSSKNDSSDINEKQSKKAYIVAVKLTETDTPVEATLDLVEILSSQESQESDETVIKAIIQNNQAVNLENIEYIAKIYKKKSDKILHQTNVTGYQMAPNSSFAFTVADEEQGFQTGEYQVHLIAKSKETNQKWEWNKAFEITKKATEENKVGASATGSDKDNSLFYTIIFVITFVLLLVLLLLLLILRKRKEKKFKEVMQYRKKKRERNTKDSPKIKKPKGHKSDKVRKKRPSDSRRPRKIRNE